MNLINLQPSFLLPLSADLMGYYFFIHNKGQMYFPKKDGVFGSSFFYKPIQSIHARNKKYGQSYRLEQTHLKILRTENQICDDGNSEPNTTMCITRHLEKTVGCSMGMLGTDPHMERYHLMIHCMPSCSMIQSFILGAIT